MEGDGPAGGRGVDVDVGGQIDGTGMCRELGKIRCTAHIAV